MRRLRFAMNSSPRVNIKFKGDPDALVSFAPMDSLVDGLGVLEVQEAKPFSEVASGSYNYFEDGDVLLAKVTPCFENGKKAIASNLENGAGFATSEVFVFRPNKDRLETRFLRYLFCSEDFRHKAIASMTGAGGLRRVSERSVLDFPLRISSLTTQCLIADFLDRETTRIDSLIEKKRRLVDIIQPRFETLIHLARETGDWRRLEYSAQITTRPIPDTSGAAYVPLGLYNRGRGFFQKPETVYDDLGDSSFSFVKKGDLVFSGQFAWEGAVGLVSDKENDCVVSHRYPVYTGLKGILSEYLFAYFRSHHGQFLMENCSRGAAGRNRPLNTRILEKEKIPVPSIELQKQISKLIEFERRLKDKIEPSITCLKEYRSALITAALTGQIDISNYVSHGETDITVDTIQKELEA